MADSTANDIMGRALAKARVYRPGESIPSPILAQVFADLNDMLERWSLEKLMVVAETLESFALIAGQSEYTYGTGGDFNSIRPDSVLDSSFIRVGNSDYSVTLKPLSLYRSMRNKTTGARPKIMAYNPEYPLATIFLWPTPTSTDSLYLRVRKQLTKFADKTTSVSLPPGFRGGIVANLAMEISPNFGKKISDSLAFQAAQFIRTIRKSNRITSNPMRTSLAAMTGRGRGGVTINSGPFI
jgi:hypothetical protein